MIPIDFAHKMEYRFCSKWNTAIKFIESFQLYPGVYVFFTDFFQSNDFEPTVAVFSEANFSDPMYPYWPVYYKLNWNFDLLQNYNKLDLFSCVLNEIIKCYKKIKSNILIQSNCLKSRATQKHRSNDRYCFCSFVHLSVVHTLRTFIVQKPATT